MTDIKHRIYNINLLRASSDYDFFLNIDKHIAHEKQRIV